MMFGDADLGDQRRTQRLVRMGAQMAARPGGKVTEVFTEPAAREAAFRLLENDDVDPAAVAETIHRATARACFGEPFVFVPVDGSSLNLTDATGAKGLGAVGARAKNARGLCVWKTGACRVEETQLREGERIEKWATMQAAVAMRILRLTLPGPRDPAAAVTAGQVAAPGGGVEPCRS
ncbi:MAG: hypothetical protein HY906_07850 [Deltaproteobacteria bacterium]|nr:hypothetical protein [Deltaproteobacteria bacterium]